jgi:hypothetical protein
MEIGEKFTAQANDVLALLKPDTSDFEKRLRANTGFYHHDAQARERSILLSVIEYHLEQRARPWWTRW